MDDIISGLIGYLNFSHGNPSPKFQRGLSDLYRALGDGPNTCMQSLAFLRERMEHVEGSSEAFREIDQARGVVRCVEQFVVPAYRHHHRDLLFHLSDQELFRPFLLARIFEVTLAQEGPWDQTDRIVAGTLEQLNDYLGHRPVAVLETAQKIQPYDHERVRPIPVYLAEAGIAVGKYETLVSLTIDVLKEIPAEVARSAFFDFGLLEELALDPRAYDHSHPVNQRPGYQFGEWDPHHIDSKGYYRRFVLRPMILDALLEWQGCVPGMTEEEAMFEASAALAGTILLASGISGNGPGTHASDISLATLVPQVARCRDLFYTQLLDRLSGRLRDFLHQDAAKRRQPFGGVRQYLNHYMAKQRARQLQHDHLSTIYAVMGSPEASLKQSNVIPTTSIRMRAELRNQITAGHRLAEQGKSAWVAIVAAEDLLHRGIHCGAFVDPWNILGFQGNFSIFPTVENSVGDPRIEQLLELLQDIFDLYAHALREAAAAGDQAEQRKLEAGLEALAAWWDKFASVEVRDLPRVSGREATQSALFVARVLVAWRESGAAAGDIAFWRNHASDFNSPVAFASVVAALLEKQDHLAAMALLMQWLSQAEQVPLEDGEVSFHFLVRKWVATLLRQGGRLDKIESNVSSEALILLKKFFDFLEANADRYWKVPGKEMLGKDGDDELARDPDEEEDIFAAAYEGITYEDSTDDGEESETMEASGGSLAADDSLAVIERELEDRLLFHSTLAHIWLWSANAPWTEATPCPKSWVRQTHENTRDLCRLMDALHEYPVPSPTATQDSIMEYDQRLALKESLLSKTISTAIESAHALRRLRGRQDLPLKPEKSAEGFAKWEPLVIGLENALRHGDVAEARRQMPDLLLALTSAPLLYVPLDQGGHPRAIFQARYVRDTLRQLACELPNLGLFRETYQLLRVALEIEQDQAGTPHQVTEFNLLFPAGFKDVVEALVESLLQWEETKEDDEHLTAIVGGMVGRFSRLWIQHVSSVRISELERRTGPGEWDATMQFIQKYGRELFTQKFMTFANLRGILHQGVGTFLDTIEKREDPESYQKFSADLGRSLKRKTAITHLEFILRAVLENYDTYKDYNTTTTQSDYGENLYMMLELLRVRSGYERHRWALQPAYIAHGVLARRLRPKAALLLRRAFEEETSEIANHYLKQLAEVEQRLGLRLPTIAERIGERFVRPLELDQALAFVEPAILETREGEPGAQFAELELRLEDFADEATGAGLEVPSWIRKLETEVERIIDDPADTENPQLQRLTGAPIALRFEDFQEQLSQWDEPVD